MLMLGTSFYGQEDPTLTDQLLAEATGILNWSLDGLDRLRDRGHFLLPASSAEALLQMEDLASPISAFVRERCEVGATKEVAVDTLYEAWRAWATSQGITRISTASTFGRDLRTQVPNLKKVRPRDGDDRHHLYQGISVGDTWRGHRDQA